MLEAATALALDASGNLYVASSTKNTVSKFAPGATAPSLVLSGLNNPIAMAFDKHGNLFVANEGVSPNYGTTVTEFFPAHTSPSVTLTGLDFPQALAFDGSGNLYVANLINDSVSVFAPGATTPTSTLTVNAPRAVAVDGSGNVFVSSDTNIVSEFAPGATTASAILTGVNRPWALAFDSRGNLYAANYAANSVSEFAPGATTPTSTIVTGQNGPAALAFDGAGNLYVANRDGNSVSEFGPTYAINDGNSGKNYTVTIATSTTGIINKAPLTIRATGNVKVYDSTTTASAAPVVSGLLGSDTATGLLEVYGDKNAGLSKTLSVSAYTVSDGNSGNNYVVTTVSTTTGVINRAGLTIAAVTNTKPYDSTTSAAATPIVSGLLGADRTSAVAEAYPSVSAGSSLMLSVSAYTINDGNGGNNYSVSTIVDGTGMITPALLSVSGVTVNNKVYDGTTTATLNTANAALLGLIGNDIVTLNTGSALGTFASKDVGNNIPVVVSGLSLGGPQANDYALTPTGPAFGSWSQFQGNAVHTGYVPGTYTLPSASSLWTVTAASVGDSTLSPSVAADGTNVYLTGYMGPYNPFASFPVYNVVALNEASGGLAWSYAHAANSVLGASPPSVLGNTVYAQFDGITGATDPSVTPYIIGLNSSNGQQLFATSYSAEVGGPNQPTIQGNAVFGWAGYYGGMQAYNGTTGATLWNANLPPQDQLIPAADSKDVYVYLGANGTNPGPSIGTLYARNEFSGTTDYTIQNGLDSVGGQQNYNQNVVLGGQNDALATAKQSNTGVYVVSYNLGTRNVAWRDLFSTLYGVSVYYTSTGAMAATGGKIYVSAGENLYILDEATGSQLAQLGVGSLQVFDKNVVVTDNLIFISSSTNTYAFDRRALNQVWSVNFGGMLAVDNQTLFISSGTTIEAFAMPAGVPLLGNITPRALAITANTATKTYDSTTSVAATPTVAGLVGSDTVTGLVEAYADGNAGASKTLSVTGFHVADGNSGLDYTVTTFSDTTGVIIKASLTFSAATKTKVYDANTGAAAMPTVSGLKGADTAASLAEVYSDSNVGSAKTLMVSVYVINDGNSGNNYLVTTLNNTTGVINAAPLTINALTNTKVFDNTPAAAAVPMVSGLLGNDSVTGLSEAYDTAAVGTGKASPSTLVTP